MMGASITGTAAVLKSHLDTARDIFHKIADAVSAVNKMRNPFNGHIDLR